MPDKARYILGFVVVFFTLAFLFNSLSIIWAAPNRTQWDFKIYYYAGEAYNQGLDPYVRENLVSVSQKEFSLDFVYPPLSLQFFRFLSLVDYDTGHKLWLVLKILSLAILGYIWKRFFIRDISLFLIIPFMLFAFDATVFWDIKAGNVGIFEQLFLWLAFWAFLKNRYILFVLLILAGSVVKFFPALLVFLLLLSKDGKKWWLLAGSLICLGLLAFVNYLINPELFDSFMRGVQAIDERGHQFNYSLLAFWDDIYLSIKGTAQLPYRIYLVHISYVATVAAVLWISVSGWIKLQKKGQSNLMVYSILLSCCIYALVVPRIKCYSLIILIPACLYLLSSFRKDRLVYLILLLGIIPVSTPFFERDTINRFFEYYPLYLTIVVWLYLIAARSEPGNVDHRTGPMIS